jgi:3-hydroxybutyryl-CoA dehydrogenase
LPETVAIIGAGPLGRWLALAAARAGFRVLLEDVMPANLHHAQEWLQEELGAELLSGGSPSRSCISKAGPSTLHPSDEDLLPGTPVPLPSAQDDSALRVAFVSTIEDAVREADLAIDCVPDELESKLEILWLLDRMAPPRTVLATPTTRLSITDLANCTYRPEKCIAIAAEASALTGGEGREILLRTAARTSRESVDLVERFWRRLGFLPVFEGEDGGQSQS